VGFGELIGLLQLMVEALQAGDVRRLRELCEYGNREYTRADSAFSPVLAFLDELAGEGTLDDYLRLCAGLDISGSVIFTGYLAPEEHRFLLPYARALLVPSLAPEAFGMVATEAMASGVVPIASCHSGLETALAPLKEVWGSDAESLLLGTPEKLVFRIAAASRFVLNMTEHALRDMGARMREAVNEEFSWDAVSKRIVTLLKPGLSGRD
ncbi:MAG: glycosyltransferase, partial [Actinobacteria bacterium]|nr:glycosyltransferase [Actinomycetota bacterium]